MTDAVTSGFAMPADGKGKRGRDHESEHADEEADQVTEMPGADIFDRSHGRTQAGSRRFASVTSGEEFYKGQARAQLGLNKQKKG